MKDGAALEQKETPVQNTKMQFVLDGFRQVLGSRIFAFEGVATDRTRKTFTVEADLALTRRYGIRLQELPLLCRAVLERRDQGDEKRAFTYTEEEMSLHARAAAERREMARKKPPPRRPSPDRVGNAWRVPPR